MTRSLKWKIIGHAFYVILAMWYTLRVSISCIDRSLTIFISKVAMIRENLLDFISTEKVNYFYNYNYCIIFYLLSTRVVHIRDIPQLRMDKQLQMLSVQGIWEKY